MDARGRLGGLVALAALLLAGGARAQDCGNAGTQMAMNVCAAQAYKAADAELNARYAEARAAMQRVPGGATALRDAQRAWIAFRDKACEVEGMQYEGGSIRPMIVASCLARLTGQRAEDLRALAGEG